MQEHSVEIINKLGLHARAAAKFVTLASGFEAEILVDYNGQQINGKSIMGVMMLAAGKGSTIHLEIDGPDEEQASQALLELINNRFDEPE
ncbi:HPr family phosphocarrier protein [Thiohalophilus thiocyanatoxydans]|uniref:Phosphocarrier protein n=1 Tax=Thiohalophilus thiocyanatoxydans TaxID=381308 RepID=A0A4R8IK24_9GAMM|nr:HPr family phosphocarrier protein [Thiohalophilus thiocyanatoxydans]TDY01081.1 phosphocarrier protein [Thiohalophilus thiocyanatoxydans]